MSDESHFENQVLCTRHNVGLQWAHSSLSVPIELAYEGLRAGARVAGLYTENLLSCYSSLFHKIHGKRHLDFKDVKVGEKTLYLRIDAIRYWFGKPLPLGD